MDQDQSRSADFLTAAQLADLLLRIAAGYMDENSGNAITANSLRKLSALVRRSSDGTVEGAFARPATRRPKQPREERTVLAGLAVDHLDLTEVETILSAGDVSKPDLLRIAMERFSIPRSRLYRMNVQAIRDSLRSAIENERAFHVISDAARDEGNRRLS